MSSPQAFRSPYAVSTIPDGLYSNARGSPVPRFGLTPSSGNQSCLICPDVNTSSSHQHVYGGNTHSHDQKTDAVPFRPNSNYLVVGGRGPSSSQENATVLKAVRGMKMRLQELTSANEELTSANKDLQTVGLSHELQLTKTRQALDEVGGERERLMVLTNALTERDAEARRDHERRMRRVLDAQDASERAHNVYVQNATEAQNKLKEELATANGHLGDREGALSKSRADERALREQNDILDAANQNLAAELSAMSRRCDAMQLEGKANAQLLMEIQQRGNAQQQQHAMESAELRAHLARLASDHSVLQQRLQLMTAQEQQTRERAQQADTLNEQLRMVNAKQEGDLAAQLAMNRELTDGLEAARAHLQTASVLRGEHTTKIAQLEQQLATERHKLEQIIARYQECKGKASAYDELCDTYEALQTKYSSTASDRKSERNKRLIAEAKLSKQSKELKALRRKTLVAVQGEGQAGVRSRRLLKYPVSPEKNKHTHSRPPGTSHHGQSREQQQLDMSSVVSLSVRKQQRPLKKKKKVKRVGDGDAKKQTGAAKKIEYVKPLPFTVGSTGNSFSIPVQIQETLAKQARQEDTTNERLDSHLEAKIEKEQERLQQQAALSKSLTEEHEARHTHAHTHTRIQSYADDGVESVQFPADLSAVHVVDQTATRPVMGDRKRSSNDDDELQTSYMRLLEIAGTSDDTMDAAGDDERLAQVIVHILQKNKQLKREHMESSRQLQEIAKQPTCL
jgi:hypothetical protein